MRKVPLIFAVGGREQAERTVSLRRLGDPAQATLSLDAAVALCQRELRSRPDASEALAGTSLSERVVLRWRGGP